MDVQTDRERYRYSMYNGNAAYEFNVREEETPQEIPHQEPVRRPKRRAAARQSYSFSITALLGFAVALGMLVFVLLAYVNLSEITNNTVLLEEKYAELTEESRKLTIAYEETFDVNELEKYAMSVLGMGKPSEGQTGTYSVTLPDKGEIIEDETAEKSFSVKDFMSFLASLTEYFK